MAPTVLGPKPLRQSTAPERQCPTLLQVPLQGRANHRQMDRLSDAGCLASVSRPGGLRVTPPCPWRVPHPAFLGPTPPKAVHSASRAPTCLLPPPPPRPPPSLSCAEHAQVGDIIWPSIHTSGKLRLPADRQRLAWDRCGQKEMDGWAGVNVQRLWLITSLLVMFHKRGHVLGVRVGHDHSIIPSPFGVKPLSDMPFNLPPTRLGIFSLPFPSLISSVTIPQPFEMGSPGSSGEAPAPRRPSAARVGSLRPKRNGWVGGCECAEVVYIYIM